MTGLLVMAVMLLGAILGVLVLISETLKEIRDRIG